MEKKRVSKTNLQVKDEMYKALCRLLKEKKPSEVSVSDLTAEANVSRMSFYRNYNTIEDVLTEHLDEIVEDYRKEDMLIETEGELYCGKKYTEHCFDYFYRYRDFLNTLTESGMGELFLARITEYLIQKWVKEETDISGKIAMSAFAGAIYNTYRFWKRNSFQMSPKELAQILTVERKNSNE